MKPTEDAVDLNKIFPNGEPAMRKTVSRLCAIVPEHLHARIWARWHAGGWKRAEVERLIAEVKEAKKTELALQTNRQSSERLRAMEIEKDQGQYIIQAAHNHAIEEKYAWEQYAAEMERLRDDPLGLWGPPTLRSERDR